MSDVLPLVSASLLGLAAHLARRRGRARLAWLLLVAAVLTWYAYVLHWGLA